MNKPFEVLVYTHPTVDDKYGVSDIEKGFDTIDEAKIYYDKVQKYYGKQLMKYESSKPDADGYVIEEDHRDKIMEENV